MQRLPHIAGEWIDRAKPIAFSFEGARYQGYEGDSVASALAANGVRMMGRSFKYHRPRGILSLANHDVNTLMQAGARLNLRADVTPLHAAAFHAVNTQGGLANDRGRWFDRFGAFLPVGFYYKAFHTPKSWFPRWERLIRRFSGLGELDFDTPRVRTAKRYAFCDVLVIGAGASGLSAALGAARAGAKVIVADENARAGGSAFFDRGGAAHAPGALDALLREVAAQPNITLKLGAEASGYFADHWVSLVDTQCMTKVRAKAVVLATGAFEQPAVFRNNDLPGVLLGSAAQRLIYRYAVQPMRRALVLAANDDAYRIALDLAANGVQVAALIDLRAGAADAAHGPALRARDIEVLSGHCIYEALASTRGDGVRAARVCGLDGEGNANVAASREIACDGIVMSVGWAPALPLVFQAGAQARYDSSVEQFVADQLPSGVIVAGRANGVYELTDKIRDGERAGIEAARHLGLAANISLREVARAAVAHSHPYPIIDHPKGRNFVDFDEDLQVKDFYHAAQEGFDSIELLKRYSTVGMGPSQGKHSNMNAIRILAKIKAKSIDEIGATTARPFFHPVPMSHLAGRGFSPERLTPMHRRHQQLNAQFMQAGDWLRPEYYTRQRISRTESIKAEVRAVHQAVGVIDVGTLGKLEVYGAQCAEFLERVYTGKFANMKIGATRYALMLDESGVVIDDGVVARLGEQHFYFTTTTSNSALIYRELARLNTLWRLNVGIVNVTGAYAAMNLAGPKSREVLRQLTGFDISDAAFPYLALREGAVAGVGARLMRVGFVGELGYEIHVPADRGAHVWDAIMQAGSHFGIQPFGVEAQRLLRLEKGHVIVGQDTDGLSTPIEANLTWALKMDKPFFIGQRSLRIIEKRPPKQMLTGFSLPAQPTGALPKECHLVIDEGNIAGRVTSCAYSEAVGRVIGLAYVAPKLNVIGGKFMIRVDGGMSVQAEVVKTPFFDPEGARQKIDELTERTNARESATV